MDHVRLLFITLLALADRDGIVYGSRSGLERAAMIDLDMAEEHDPWKILMSPDSDSSDLMRNPDNEGRRIEEVPGGFRIINYVYYRSLRDSEDRKAQNREAQRRHREKISPRKPRSATISRHNPIESEIEIKKDKKASGKPMLPAFDCEAWLSELEKDETYKGLNIRQEFGKCRQWCAVRGLTLSKRRFVNWINKAEKPITSNGSKSPYKRNYLPPPREVSDEEFTHAREIARLEASTLRQKFRLQNKST